VLGGKPDGTAAHMTSWLLVEQPGPWPEDALETALAEAFPTDRLVRARAAGLRPLLIRRPGRHKRANGATRAVYVASGMPGNRWLERLEITDLAELANLDLDAITTGHPDHGQPVDGPLFLVCTHGTKDMCCAVLGRPVAAALAANHPGRTWEVSHVGGDRWAGNLLVVPDGYLHGQLEPDEATLVAKAALTSQVDPDHLRGRTSAETRWAQTAEIAVRRLTGLRGLDSVLTLTERAHESEEDSYLVQVQAGQDRYEVTARRQRPRTPCGTGCTAALALADVVVDEIRALNPPSPSVPSAARPIPARLA
jgi:hypothetical protein